MQGIDFRDKRVTVMGLGLFGGGAGLTRFLARQGARLVVTDLRGPNQLSTSLATLETLPLELHLGGHREEDFTDVDMVVVNPAVPKDSRFLKIARENNIPLETEINLFFKLCPAPIVGVTGSKGKSTTTAILGELLKGLGKKVWLGGNIGRGYSLLEHVDKIRPEDLVVLELSSFQLEDLAGLKKSPRLSIVTNIAPNHLDRHKDMQSYIEAKKTILRFQNPEDCVILNYDDPELRTWPRHTRARALWFSTTERLDVGACLVDGQASLRIDSRELRLSCLPYVKLPGMHNIANILAASLAAFFMGVLRKDMEEVIRNFSGLEHRLEFVQEVDGVQYYNDSIATTPESAIAGLKAFTRPVVLIAGGYDKGSPFEDFARECSRRARGIILIGQTAKKIGALITKGKGPLYASSLEEAVTIARAVSQKGDVVLLSPACASYDMFINFEHRGRQFKAQVKAMASRSASGG